MLLAIFGAFEHAEVLARAYLGEIGAVEGGNANGGSREEDEMVGYVDEMEWEGDVG